MNSVSKPDAPGQKSETGSKELDDALGGKGGKAAQPDQGAEGDGKKALDARGAEQPDDKESPKPSREQKPDNVPPGTKPIDQDKRLDRQDIHAIKDQLGARPKDWVGIDPAGNIWTNEAGSGANQGHYTDFVN